MGTIRIDYNVDDVGIGRLAILMSMSSDREQEQLFKDFIQNSQYVGCITEIGASTQDFSAKMMKAVIGACLNNEVVSKTSHEIHALLHAATEAKQSMLVNSSTSLNLAVKVCILRSEHWIAVAMFGYSAMSTLTNHERVGLGIMHI